MCGNRSAVEQVPDLSEQVRDLFFLLRDLL
jgi:hypothetical protein